jgi:glycosyltransferase involved in cell wall biosynthesis
MPRISVILPCYNGSSYIYDAIGSILDQTFPDFELIVIDDGSTDDSAEIIQTFDDSRIRFFQQRNQGLPATLNRAISLANGEYLARMDADDISLPARFERQVDFLEKHPEHGMVGTWASIWADRQKTSRFHRPATECSLLKFDLLFYNSIVHSSTMIRRKVFVECGEYATEETRQPQDYDLWSRMMRHYEMTNLPEVLHIYRETATSISATRTNDITDQLERFSIENIAWVAGRCVDDPLPIAMASLVRGRCPGIVSTPSLEEMVDVMVDVVARLRCTDEAINQYLRARALQRLEVMCFVSYPCRYGNFKGRVLRLIDKIMGKPGRLAGRILK